jgi:hypothetical protein
MAITILSEKKSYTGPEIKILANELLSVHGRTLGNTLIDKIFLHTLVLFDRGNRTFETRERLTEGIKKEFDPIYYASTKEKTVEQSHPKLIKLAHPTAKIVLYRGCNKHDAAKMCLFMSAGGINPQYDCDKPSEDEIKGQVGEGQFKRVGEMFTKIKLPEFTHDKNNAMMRRVDIPGVVMGVVRVKILRKYIVRGDEGIMQGWCTKPEAPLCEWVSFTPYK